MHLPSKERMSQIILMLSCGALVCAWIAQYVFGFQACVLCLYQRYLYIVAIVLLAISLYFFGGRYPRLFLILTAFVLLACAGTAAYQVAIEQNWVPLPKICGGDSLPTGSFEDFQAAMLNNTTVPCNKVTWSLLGISMAGYNFLLALFLSILSFIGVFGHDSKKKKFARR